MTQPQFSSFSDISTATPLPVTIPSGGSSVVTLSKKKLTTATLSNVSGSASSVTILAANTNREDAWIFNDSSVNLRIKLGATASSTSFSMLIPPQSGFFLSDQASIYTGIIDGIWDSATGAARVTEITA